MQVTLYQRPHGRQTQIEVTNIEPDDEQWLEENTREISMEEESEDNIIVYADVGQTMDDDETPLEVIEISNGRSCEETMAALRVQCESILKRAA